MSPERWERGTLSGRGGSGNVGVGKGTVASWSPPRREWCQRPWVFSFPPAFLASYFPASRPPSFIQHRSDLCWALVHHRHIVRRCPKMVNTSMWNEWMIDS